MTRKDLLELEKIEHYPSLSIFIPTHRSMPEKMQNRIKIKDMVGQAAEKLLSQFEKKDLLNLFKNLDDLIEKMDYTGILDGLAIFINKDVGKIFNLPFKVDERIVINNKFAIKELLSALSKSHNYLILALSKSPTRLFSAHNNNVEEIIDSKELQEKQEGFPFQLNYDVTSDRELLAVGTGDKDSQYLTELDKNFYILVDKLLTKHINQDNLPVVILTIDENKGTFDQITKNKNQIIGYSKGDFSKSTAEEISKAAWPVMKEYLEQEQKTAINLFKEKLGTNETSFGIKEVWNSTQDGRSRIILIERDYKALGSLNPQNLNNIILKEDTQLPLNQDLIDDLVDLAINKNSKIVFVEPNSLKEYGHIAAILRY